MLFPIIVANYGIAVTMTILAVMATAACLVVVTFAPETYRRSVETLEADAIAPAEPVRAVQ
jgi:hypothetical protein